MVIILFIDECLNAFVPNYKINLFYLKSIVTIGRIIDVNAITTEPILEVLLFFHVNFAKLKRYTAGINVRTIKIYRMAYSPFCPWDEIISALFSMVPVRLILNSISELTFTFLKRFSQLYSSHSEIVRKCIAA